MMQVQSERKLPSIRTMLAVVVMACILPSLLGIGLLIVHFYYRERAQLERDALQTARALTAAVDRDLGIGENVALTLATSASLAANDLAAFHAQARSLLRDEFPGFTFVLSDESGQQLVNTARSFGDALPRHGNPDQLHRVLKTGKTIISDVYIGGVMKRALVGIDVPVWRDGKAVHALSVGFLPERLGRILTEQNLPPDRVVTIYDSKGVVVARTHLAERYVGQKGPPVLSQRMQEATEGTVETDTLDGIPVFASFNRSSKTGWTVSIGIPEATVLDELLHSVRLITLVVLLLLVAGFGAAWIIGGRIGRSVTALTTSALALGKGIPIDVPRARFREVVDVAAALKKVEAELDGHRHHLEGLVIERTAALHASTTRLAQVLEAAGEGICGFDAENHLTFANRTAAELLGWPSPENMLGVAGAALTHHLLADGHPCGEGNCSISQTLTDGEVRRVNNEYFGRTDGTHFPVEYVVAPHMADGRVAGVVVVFGDVSDKRAAAQELVLAHDKAQAASRAKSEFVANMSHEIRTPMNAILGLAHLLERTQLTAEQRDLSGKIRVAGRGLLSIINDILDFSRVEAGRLDLEVANFHLPDLMDAISTIMSVNASAKDLELVISVAPGTPSGFVGDSLRLQQILLNLTSNAIKFTEQGEVVVRVEQVDTAEDKAILRFSVRDTGIGISPDVITNVFDAFSQADSSTTRRYGGSGLGLAISKRLVELMGGRLGAESQPGHGSTFWFTVPLGLSAPLRPARNATAELDILIADDHDIAREVIASTASSLGWAVEAVGSGREAVERAQERLRCDSPFDVLILDWRMPDVDGLAVSRIVRNISAAKSPIVIMVTAHDREDVQRAPEAGLVDAVLVKPVTGSSLFNAVMEARARRAGCTDGLLADLDVATDSRRLEHVRLLVVEDNGINQEVAKRILELEGALVTIAVDGQQAVSMLARGPDAFDAVLMDVQMPVMDGYEATTHIRHDLGLSALPIIALTAGALDSERKRAQDAGMVDFVAKPFDVEQMVQCIRRHLSAPPPSPTETACATRSPLELLETDIPGIDMRQASLRLGGDSELFASLLTRLDQQFAEVASCVRTDLAAGKADDAARRLHTLRGAAGNVAAVAVASLASLAEAAIRDEQQEEILPLLDRLENAMTALVHNIRQRNIVTAIEQDHGNMPAPLDRDMAMAVVAFLESRSMNAISAFNQLRPALTRTFGENEIIELARKIDGLMFDAAARRLRVLLTEK